MVSKIDISAKPVQAVGQTEEPTDNKWYYNKCEGIKKGFQSKIIVPVGVIGRAQCQKIPVSPKKTKGYPHYKASKPHACHGHLLQCHHKDHGSTAQQHPEAIQSRNLKPVQQKSID